MRLHVIVIVAQHICSAVSISRYAISAGCSGVNLGVGQPADYTQGIADGMREAVEIANDAYDILQKHSNEKDVEKICQTVLGDDAEKLRSAKETMRRLAEFTKDPYQFPAEHTQWLQERSNRDVEFYCDLSRFIIQDSPDVEDGKRITNKPFDNHCYNEKVSEGYLNFYSGQTETMAMTTDSDLFNGFKWVKEKAFIQGKSRQDPEFSTPRPHLASQVDLAPYAMEAMRGSRWPKIDATRIEICMQEDYITKFLAESKELHGIKLRSPIDALQNLAQIILHELTHTVQGGFLKDSPNKKECYGWYCVQKHKDPKNADTIAWLAIALRLWKIGYMTNAEGQVTRLHS